MYSIFDFSVEIVEFYRNMIVEISDVLRIEENQTFFIGLPLFPCNILFLVDQFSTGLRNSQLWILWWGQVRLFWVQICSRAMVGVSVFLVFGVFPLIAREWGKL